MLHYSFSWMFSFYICLQCFHFSSSRLFSLINFLGCFLFSPFSCFIFHRFRVFLSCYTASATDLRKLFLLSGVFYLTFLSHICHSTASATDLRELFLFSDVFYLTLLPDICTTCFYQGFSGSRQFVLEGCRASHFETQTRPICLFWITQCLHCLHTVKINIKCTKHLSKVTWRYQNK